MTRYLKKCRIVGLAGLVSLAVFALPAAPAGATVTCPPGNANPNYCKTVITESEQITIQGNTVTVTINVTDPPVPSKLHLTVTLRHKGKVRTLFNENVQLKNGKVTELEHFKKPTDPGTYDVKAVATANHVTKTVDKKFTIKKHKKHK